MQTPNAVLLAITAVCLIALAGLAKAEEAPKSLQSDTDTIGRLLQKQALLLDSEMDAAIRKNKDQGMGVASVGANPLASVKQEVSETEPIVEAIWGIKGKEVAEVSYKGRRVPVSMQEPFISKVDGWKLESIQQYMINMVQQDERGRVTRRKTIMLNFLGGEGSQSGVGTGSSMPAPPVAPINPITPAITGPLMR
ncbi:hypothetical protein ACLIN3_27245 (plasmid) [Pseudomonas orientalis]|uniref:hypothetical protein n=1 Tax=Pseudomonas orientalis TaxID=76758 RepID=UPI00398767EB